MGPVWDFDLAFGNNSEKSVIDAENWLIKNSYWNLYLEKDSLYSARKKLIWNENKKKITAMLDTVENRRTKLRAAAKNNFKRWKILSKINTSERLLKSFESYDESLDDLRDWMRNRIQWIDDDYAN